MTGLSDTAFDEAAPIKFAQKSDAQLVHATSRRLHDLVVAGTFKLGEPLPPQRDLARTLKVSRSSLREALSILETLGVVRTVARQGTVVVAVAVSRNEAMSTRSDSGYEQADIYQFRFMIEGYGARIAASRATQVQIEEIAANVTKSRVAVRDMDLLTYMQCDFEFHRLILACSGSRLLLDLYDRFGPAFRENLRLPLASHRRLSEPLNEHENVLRALERHSGDDAAYFIHLHVIKAADRAGVPFNEVA